MSTVDTAAIAAVARAAGADAVGFTSADPFIEARTTLSSRKEMGLAGPLHFTYDDPDTASQIRSTYPWAESLVVVGCNYTAVASPPAGSGAVVGRFATADHYERVRDVAEAVAAELRSRGGRTASVIDDNRLLDRAAAVRAGVGWIGHSTMVLTPGHGPWLLLGSVVTDLVLEQTTPMSRTCGSCVACVPACPTGRSPPTGSTGAAASRPGCQRRIDPLDSAVVDVGSADATTV
jgi:epoxyqueuosine reductase